MPSVLLSVNVVVTESRTSPSAALGKDFFVEYGEKVFGKALSIWQRDGFR